MTVVEDKLFWHDGPEPECWDDAARRCVYSIYSMNLYSMDTLEDMRVQLDWLINIGTGKMVTSKEMTEEEYADSWRTLGAVARNAAKKLNILDYSLERPGPKIDELTSVLIKKQKDYGHDNISRFGRLGLLVRVHDKIARLENLARREAEPENESLRDNYMDVINYCAIGMMVEMEWFPLELASN